MKTNKDFNLSKSTKRMLAAMPQDKRGHWKNMMIEAQVLEKRAKLAKITSKNDKGEV